MTHDKKLNDTRLYINGNTQFSSLDEARYHDLLVHPLMAAASTAKHVLILGGGDGLALREVNKYNTIESVTLVDLDPAMTKLAANNEILTALNKKAFQNAKLSVETMNLSEPGSQTGVYLTESNLKHEASEFVASVTVFNVDADQFLRRQPKALWDAVIIDLPDPSSIELSKLYTKQFYLSLRRYLTDQAVIAVQSTSPYHAKKAYLAIGSTLGAAGFNVLPYRQNIPSFGDWGYYLAWTHAQEPAAMKKKLSSLTGFSVEPEFLTTDLLAAAFAFGKGELSTDDTCINTIMQPCLLTRYVDQSWLIQ